MLVSEPIEAAEREDQQQVKGSETIWIVCLFPVKTNGLPSLRVVFLKVFWGQAANICVIQASGLGEEYIV